MAQPAIRLKTSLPAEAQDPSRPYRAIIVDLSGYREPLSENLTDEEFESAELARFAAVDVDASTFDDRVKEIWNPRFKGAVRDTRYSDPQKTFDVDISLPGRSKTWPLELDKVPEIAEIDQFIERVERFQAELDRKSSLRDNLDGLLHAIWHAMNDSAHADQKLLTEAK
jgi:predicted component of type VI protein secretion system